MAGEAAAVVPIVTIAEALSISKDAVEGMVKDGCVEVMVNGTVV